MEYRNVTISLPSTLLREARHLAVDRGMSLSRFLAEILEEHVHAARRYREASERQQRLLREGLTLGTRGQIGWKREELYQR
jgi:hypothetical protein